MSGSASFRVIQTFQQLAQTGDPSVTTVGMNDGAGVDVLPTEAHHLLTHGINGCQVVALITKFQDGKRHMILTHYPPTDVNQNAAKLNALITKNPELKDPGAKHVVLTFSPGKHAENYNLKPLFPNVTRQLEVAIQNALGPRAAIETHPVTYPMHDLVSSGKSLTVSAYENGGVFFDSVDNGSQLSIASGQLF